MSYNTSASAKSKRWNSLQVSSGHSRGFQYNPYRQYGPLNEVERKNGGIHHLNDRIGTRSRSGSGLGQQVRCRSALKGKESSSTGKERERGRSTGSYLDYVLLKLTRNQVPFLGLTSTRRGGDVDSNCTSKPEAEAVAHFDDKVIVIEGEARHLGMNCDWKQHYHYPSGAFYEELSNEDMHVWWGFDGKDCTWEVDFSGLPTILELDDKETSLLCTWIRNGIWLMPEIRDKLHITLAEEVEEPRNWQLLREQSFGSMDGVMDEQLALSSHASSSSAGAAEAAEGEGEFGSNSLILEVQLKKGKVKARLEVCTRTWLPVDLTLPVCGDIEKTSYIDFAPMRSTRGGEEADVEMVFPKHTIQVASGGGQNEYWAKDLYLKEAEEESRDPYSVFSVPHVPLFPPDTSFDAEAGKEIDYFKARSGHIVVKPKINGKDISGMMILDTGASGFVITKSLADELDLSSFGELYVAGVTQKVKSQFRRAATIQLGPVCMSNPLFMEMNIDGVVHGSPEPIVGILGYDFFRRCVVEMPPLQQNVLRSGFVPRSKVPLPKNKIIVHNPAEYKGEEEDYSDKLVWKELQLVANVPHIRATFCKSNGSEHSALFMLDSGAGGAGIMFHARASEEYQLLEPASQDDDDEALGNTKSIRGIGGESSSGGMKVFEGNMRYLQVSGARFENVLSLIAMGGGFDLSLHTAGMICADLMVKCRVIFDYPRKRFAMIQENRTMIKF